jgi:tRNA(His) 5'-end guanylyltransferase
VALTYVKGENMKKGKDLFGDRMKEYEQSEAGRKGLKYLPICVRLDGKNFSKLTKNLERPYCKLFHNLMIEVTKILIKETGANIGYTQSDEISLIYHNTKINSELYFNGKFQKLTSVLASMATAHFNNISVNIPFLNDLAIFDARAWNVPNVIEAVNTLLWREMDATKNSITTLARCYYSHNEIKNKSCKEMLDMLYNKNVLWNKMPAEFKRGTYIVRVSKTLDEEELKKRISHLKGEIYQKAKRNIFENIGKVSMVISSINLPPLKTYDKRYDILTPIDMTEFLELKKYNNIEIDEGDIE